jgi:hypothetical protein
MQSRKDTAVEVLHRQGRRRHENNSGDVARY